MGRRLALLAETSHEGPWTHANGSESAIRVIGLGIGDKIALIVRLRPDGDLLLFFPEGYSDLKSFSPGEWQKYRVVKLAGNQRMMTTVEVLLGNARY